MSLMTLQEAAAYLRVGKSTLYRWIAEGTAPAHTKIGRAYRFERSALEAFAGTDDCRQEVQFTAHEYKIAAEWMLEDMADKGLLVREKRDGKWVYFAPVSA